MLLFSPIFWGDVWRQVTTYKKCFGFKAKCNLLYLPYYTYKRKFYQKKLRLKKNDNENLFCKFFWKLSYHSFFYQFFFFRKFIMRCIICEWFWVNLCYIIVSANCGDPDNAECQRWPDVFCHWNYQIQKQCPHRCNLCPTQ